MTENKLRDLIESTVALDRRVAELTDELKARKALLVAEAQSREDEQISVDGAGTKWVGAGGDGSLCRVVFPGRKLKSTVDPESKPGQKILELAGREKATLFVPSVVYRLADNFREEAEARLGKGPGGKLIRACESESSPRVEFETKPETK